MKHILFLLSFIFFISCSSSVERPNSLLSRDEMAKIIADLAIYNQSYLINPQIRIENVDIFVLKKYNTDVEIFRESYLYYIYSPSSLDEIYDKAKEIILKKDPSLKNYMKMNKENLNND